MDIFATTHDVMSSNLNIMLNIRLSTGAFSNNNKDVGGPILLFMDILTFSQYFVNMIKINFPSVNQYTYYIIALWHRIRKILTW